MNLFPPIYAPAATPNALLLAGDGQMEDLGIRAYEVEDTGKVDSGNANGKVYSCALQAPKKTAREGSILLMGNLNINATMRLFSFVA